MAPRKPAIETPSTLRERSARSFRLAPKAALAVLLCASAAAAEPNTEAQSAGAAEPAAPAAESSPDLDKARAHFLQGVQFYNNGDYKLSLVEFRRSYELSGNYRILYNIGQVNQQLGNYTNALAALEQYLRDGGTEVPEDRKKEVTDNVAQLQRRVAHFRLIANVDSPEILVDGFPVKRSDPKAAITVDPGDHRVDVRKQGYQATGTIVTLAAGEVSEVRLHLHPVASPVYLATPGPSTPAPRKDATWLWIGWSTTGAAALGAGITGVLASMQASELADLRNSPTSTQSQRDDVGRRAKSFALASDILTGTAIAAGAASLYLTLRPAGDTKEQKPTPTTKVGLGPTGVRLIRSF